MTTMTDTQAIQLFCGQFNLVMGVAWSLVVILLVFRAALNMLAKKKGIILEKWSLFQFIDDVTDIVTLMMAIIAIYFAFSAA